MPFLQDRRIPTVLRSVPGLDQMTLALEVRDFTFLKQHLPSSAKKAVYWISSHAREGADLPSTTIYSRYVPIGGVEGSHIIVLPETKPECVACMINSVGQGAKILLFGSTAIVDKAFAASFQVPVAQYSYFDSDYKKFIVDYETQC